MPQAPIIIPLIIVGFLFGTLLKNHGRSISKKSVGIACLAAGALNGAYAYLLDVMSPTPTTSFPTGTAATFTGRTSFALRPASPISFAISGVVVGVLIVLLVVGVALIYRRFSRRSEEEPVLEEKSSDELLG